MTKQQQMEKTQLMFKIANVKKNIDRAYDSYYTLLSIEDEERANKVADYIAEREETLEKLETEYNEKF